MEEHREVRVRGAVQGVGFRPTVYRLAQECQLRGEVFNDADGVLIRLSGTQADLRRFVRQLKVLAPPLSKIDAIEVRGVEADWHYNSFSITGSKQASGQTEVRADAASCRACLSEVSTADERRYLYPFTNCTHCGPRLSIIQGIPYDRHHTTMRDFPLCGACLQEHQAPLDRRFHAQPIACHDCGPRLLLYSQAQTLAPTDPSQSAAERSARHLQAIDQALHAGKILALKGLGGFHLCCDASNHRAVSLLRQRKKRYAKPFALMSPSLQQIAEYCELSDLERRQLSSPAAPIVLLNRQSAATRLAAAIAPGSNLLGFMLPYTPLHSLISQRFAKPLVMTSGNLSGEPQIIDNQEAIDKLGDMADIIVYHDREIANRIDDSVVRCINEKPRLLRRARGFAPHSLRLHRSFDRAQAILAYGAELKSTFCLLRHGAAILSQHQGDLEDLSTFDDYEKNLALYRQLFEFAPRHLACDLHPEYLSSKLAHADAARQDLNVMAVQHHHAHIASCMAEHQLAVEHPAILGIALDGLGFGGDQTLWGAEFLLADFTQSTRLASFTPIAMLGGAQAIKQPWRNSYAHILNSMSWDDFIRHYGASELATFFSEKPLETLHSMLEKQLNCPLASSCGRLFDAVAAALDLSREHVHFEGQAAIELEMLVDAEAIFESRVDRPYTFSIQSGEAQQQHADFIRINAASIWPEILDDLKQGTDKGLIATRFHAGLLDAITAVVRQLAQQHTFDTVALSGGCLQNRVLLQGLELAFRASGLRCLSHEQVPANDGGIALGQAAIAAATLIQFLPLSSNQSQSQPNNTQGYTQGDVICV